jgi:hypothetical protein
MNLLRYRTLPLLAATVTVVVLAGCGSSGQHPDAEQPGTTITTTVPTATTAAPTITTAATATHTNPASTRPTADPFVLRPDGIGPYAIGASFTALNSAKLLANVQESPHCTDAAHAEGTGYYAGKIALTFGDGRLVQIGTNSPAVHTSTGAKVGMLLTEVSDRYGSLGQQLDNHSGGYAVIVRHVPAHLALLLFANRPTGPVAAITAGEQPELEAGFNRGEGC